MVMPTNSPRDAYLLSLAANMAIRELEKIPPDTTGSLDVFVDLRRRLRQVTGFEPFGSLELATPVHVAARLADAQLGEMTRLREPRELAAFINRGSDPRKLTSVELARVHQKADQLTAIGTLGMTTDLRGDVLGIVPRNLQRGAFRSAKAVDKPVSEIRDWFGCRAIVAWEMSQLFRLNIPEMFVAPILDTAGSVPPDLSALGLPQPTPTRFRSFPAEPAMSHRGRYLAGLAATYADVAAASCSPPCTDALSMLLAPTASTRPFAELTHRALHDPLIGPEVLQRTIAHGGLTPNQKEVRDYETWRTRLTGQR